MGADHSSEPATLYLEALDRLVGAESVPLSDPFWRRQLAYLLDPPATSWDQSQILHFLQTSAAKLGMASFAIHTAHCCSIRLGVVVSSPECSNKW
jgi:hypothetical protein